jgi:catechol 2,3-dioxygenase-like lactoylglutathione lyase family enzyme
MYDHIGLRVKDLKSAVRFYQATLEPLGFVLDSSGTGFGPKGQPGLWLSEGKGGPLHIAFRAADPQGGRQVPRRGPQGRRARQRRPRLAH